MGYETEAQPPTPMAEIQGYVKNHSHLTQALFVFFPIPLSSPSFRDPDPGSHSGRSSPIPITAHAFRFYHVGLENETKIAKSLVQNRHPNSTCTKSGGYCQDYDDSTTRAATKLRQTIMCVQWCMRTRERKASGGRNAPKGMHDAGPCGDK